MSTPVAEDRFLAALARSCDNTEGGRAVYRYFFPAPIEIAMAEESVTFNLALAELIEVDGDLDTELISAFRITAAGLARGRNIERETLKARPEEDLLEARTRRAGQ